MKSQHHKELFKALQKDTFDEILKGNFDIIRLESEDNELGYKYYMLVVGGLKHKFCFNDDDYRQLIHLHPSSPFKIPNFSREESEKAINFIKEKDNGGN